MKNEWRDRLAKLLEEKNAQHNIAAALREAPTDGPTGCRDGGTEKIETPQDLTAKTAKTLDDGKNQLQDCQNPAAKTAKTPDGTEDKASELGLVARWSIEFGYVSLYDPVTGEWHDVPTKEAPGWAKWEASKRKELYKSGNRKAYQLTSCDMSEIWEAEHALEPEGIVEDHPVEEED